MSTVVRANSNTALSLARKMAKWLEKRGFNGVSVGERLYGGLYGVSAGDLYFTVSQDGVIEFWSLPEYIHVKLQVSPSLDILSMKELSPFGEWVVPRYLWCLETLFRVPYQIPGVSGVFTKHQMKGFRDLHHLLILCMKNNEIYHVVPREIIWLILTWML